MKIKLTYLYPLINRNPDPDRPSDSELRIVESLTVTDEYDTELDNEYGRTYKTVSIRTESGQELLDPNAEKSVNLKALERYANERGDNFYNEARRELHRLIQ